MRVALGFLVALLMLLAAPTGHAGTPGPAVQGLLPPAPGPEANPCDGNSTQSALDCIANSVNSVPVLGPVAGAVAHAAANTAERAACGTVSAGPTTCAAVDALFFKYVHSNLHVALDALNCVVKYGAQCLRVPLPVDGQDPLPGVVALKDLLDRYVKLPGVCPAPAVAGCLPL